MNTQSAFLSELQLQGVPNNIPRFGREITPAQEGLLDCMCHLDAPQLLDALTWLIDETTTVETTPVNGERLALVNNMMAWLSDVVEERGSC